MQYEDKYIRDYAFDPEILVERAETPDLDDDELKKVNKKYKSEKFKRGRLSLFLRPPPHTIQEEIDDENCDDYSDNGNINNNNYDYRGSYSILNEIKEISEVDKEVDEFYCVSTRLDSFDCQVCLTKSKNTTDW